MIRSFEVGDGPALAAAWTAAAPADPIGYPRFRDLFLLDRNLGKRYCAGMLHQTDQVGGLAVCTGTTYGFAIKRLAVQDFALRADHGTVWFCHDCD